MAVRSALQITILIVAGEAIFGLPFHVARFFRPTLLSGLGLTNTELGSMFSAYGLCAMLCYVPGGLLADRFPARRLMAVSLLLTGVAGFYLATLPDLTHLLLVFAGLGVTTILLFWAALIRATRLWGGPQRQGLSFGILDGGRGLVAAGLASIALLVYRAAFVADGVSASHASRLAALRGVFLVYTVATLITAAAIWLLVPEHDEGPRTARFRREHLRVVLAAPATWLQGLVLFSAYCAFKGIDNYALFVAQAREVGEVEATRISVLAAWIRPFAALGAGLLADRIRPTRAACLCFAALLLGYLAFLGVEPLASTATALWTNIAVTCGAAFALRGVYPAIMQEVGVPAAMTGTTVGVISLIGFLPDVFIGALTGWLLDRSPGLTGFHHFFVFLAGVSLVGLLASALLAGQRSQKQP